MTDKRLLGDVLLDSGRATREDVERALEHQRTHGGYFGEAAVALGLLTREEVDWALANQLDLPFIFPDPQAADRRAAELVTPAWALAHLAVPILCTDRTVTVVVADPLDAGTLEALGAQTGLEVEMALASASRIRALIHALYGGDAGPAGAVSTVEGPGAGASPAAPVDLPTFLTEALADGADRIGISARGASAQGWYTVGARRERLRLAGGWEAALDERIDPSPIAAAREAPGLVRPFEATLRHGGRDFALDVRVATSPGGVELLLRPRRPAAPPSSAGSLPAAIRTELRLLARGGDARVGVAPPLTDLLPQLPELVLGDAVRAAHVTPQPDVPGVFVLPVRDDIDFAALLDGYAFDALSVDLPLEDPRLAAILAGAPLAFAALSDDADAGALERAGINWILSASPAGDPPVWELRPVQR